ncbi:hypothetical protein AB0M31_04295 [Streptomyces sp. NPDC051773]|uniref:hypothetical protein n=1 Tax=Streptomyces sp. NPDC051773 TaxID=3156682 RepID=UPI0034484E59
MNTPFRTPWDKPSPPGYGAAIEAATNIAAPLLAGFSITTIGVVSADSDKFRWPSIALLLLTLAAILLVASLQLGFHARMHLYSKADLAAWWGEETDLEQLKEEQVADMESWRRIKGLARVAYNAGIVFLAVGISAALVPRSEEDSVNAALRWAACGLGLTAAALEFANGVVNPIASRVFRKSGSGN